VKAKKPSVQEPPAGEAEAAEAAGPALPLWEHLEALRRVLWHVIAAWALTTTLCAFFVRGIWSGLLLPLHQPGLPPAVLRWTGPASGFLTLAKLALLAGAVLAVPAALYLVAGFVVPGLYPRERRLLRGALAGGTLFFLVGAGFGYAMLFPSLRFLLGVNLAGTIPDWPVETHLSFCLGMLLGTGLAFELPVLLYALVRLGLASAALLVRLRPYAVIAIFLVAAIVTPPDVVSQVMVGVPMWLLYELCIVLARRQERRSACSRSSATSV
jgi:sec-independent protein translocase protein TatC